MRAVAAVMVLSSHATSLLVPPSAASMPVWNLVRDHLNSGFQLFFVISGFLIAGPFLRDLIGGAPLPDVRAYTLRRVARIAPAFWVVLIVYVSLTPSVDWRSVLVHATFTHDLVLHESGAILPVAWTLGIEAAFYAFVPLAAAAVRAARPRVSSKELATWICIAWVMSVAWELAFSVALHGPYGSAAVSPRDDVLKLFTISLPGLFYMFCPGLLVAIWCIDGNDRWAIRAHPTALLLSGTTVWLAAAALEGAIGGALGACIGDQIRGVAFGAVLLGIVSWRRAPGPFLRAAAALGVVSYGVYLWHWIVIHALELASGRAAPFAGPLGTPAAVAVALVATLPFAILSWKLVESPCLRFAAAVNRRRADQPAVALGLEIG